MGFLGACASPSAMLGPAYTFGTTGNTLQTGFTYGSNELITQYTGKSPLEHALNYSENNKGSEKVKVKKQKKTTKYTNCVPFLEPVSTDMCTKIKNKISKLSGINNLN